jgi:formylglycine-generating enzyme required for sulfatase activity/serine/threonine protein kinase
MDERLGKYEILGTLGTGKLSVVYRARDTSELDRIVALKVLGVRLDSGSEAADRFLREARTASGLMHPNIGVVHEVGIQDGSPFIASELMGGRDLKTLLAGRYPFTLPQKLHVSLAVARALQYAHERGVVHRNVKPANVHLLQDGTVKLLDFGMVQLEGAHLPEMARSGALSAHIPYLSPEQLRGEALTRSTDVFSFGVLFYELLSSTRLFDGANDSAIVVQILGFDPRTMDVSGVPEGLQELLESCLKRSVEERLDSFDIVVVELDRVKSLLSEDRPLAIGESEPVSAAVARARAKVVGLTAPRSDGKKPEPAPASAASPLKSAEKLSLGPAAGQATLRPLPRRVPQPPPPKPPGLMTYVAMLFLALAVFGALVVAAVAIYQPPWLSGLPYGSELLGFGRLVRILVEPLIPSERGTPTPTGIQTEPTETPAAAAPAVAESRPSPVPRAPAVQPGGPTRKPRTPGPEASPAATQAPAEAGHPTPAAAQPTAQATAAAAPAAAETVPAAAEPNRWVAGHPAAVALPNGVRIELAWIPEGTFQMGCSPDDEDCNGDERPTHQVQLDGFWLGRSEVTQGQWKAVMGSNPSTNEGDDRPVDGVRWDDARDFTRKAGQELRLPTEAEWEYAARGGVDEPTYGPIDSVAWTSWNSGSESHPVAQKRSNAFGLFDMLGNVWEWCQDRYDLYPAQAVANPQTTEGEYGVTRGGSYFRAPRYSRASARNGVKPSYLATDLGFRVARSAPKS